MLRVEAIGSQRVTSFLLVIVAIVMILSVRNDTLTTDEGLYLPTAYKIVTERNIRLGFEHPPLIRALVAIPLITFLDLKPAAEFYNPLNPDLNNEVWAFGDRFVYSQEESAEDILLAGRLVMIGMFLIFAFYFQRMLQRRYGPGGALLALLLLVGSPFFLAHGRLVTLDVATAIGAFLVIWSFSLFLKRGDWPTAVLAGVTLAAAQLIKFSMLTMLPYLLLVIASFVWLQRRQQARMYFFRTLAIFVLAFLVIGGVYALHLHGYPPEQQAQDIRFVLSTTRPDVYPSIAWMADLAEFELTRPWAEYMFGAAWQLLRQGAFGYFNGEGSNSSWMAYYPVGYLVKQPIAFHLLTLVALSYLVKLLLTQRLPAFCKKILERHLFLTLGALWIVYYLVVLIGLNKGNTGSRYLMPILPFVAAIVGIAVSRWASTGKRQAIKVMAITLLVAWQVVDVGRFYPSFLPYFNDLVAKERRSHLLVDTDVEWGQDTKRLYDWLRQHQIGRFFLATELDFYNDGSEVRQRTGIYSHAYDYYLKGSFDRLQPGIPVVGWVVIPARLLRWGQTKAAAKAGWFSSSYDWLKDHAPVAVVGDSIYIFHISR